MDLDGPVGTRFRAVLFVIQVSLRLFPLTTLFTIF